MKKHLRMLTGTLLALTMLLTTVLPTSALPSPVTVTDLLDCGVTAQGDAAVSRENDELIIRVQEDAEGDYDATEGSGAVLLPEQAFSASEDVYLQLGVSSDVPFSLTAVDAASENAVAVSFGQEFYACFYGESDDWFIEQPTKNGWLPSGAYQLVIPLSLYYQWVHPLKMSTALSSLVVEGQQQGTIVINYFALVSGDNGDLYQGPDAPLVDGAFPPFGVPVYEPLEPLIGAVDLLPSFAGETGDYAAAREEEDAVTVSVYEGFDEEFDIAFGGVFCPEQPFLTADDVWLQIGITADEPFRITAMDYLQEDMATWDLCSSAAFGLSQAEDPDWIPAGSYQAVIALSPYYRSTYPSVDLAELTVLVIELRDSGTFTVNNLTLIAGEDGAVYQGPEAPVLGDPVPLSPTEEYQFLLKGAKSVDLDRAAYTLDYESNCLYASFYGEEDDTPTGIRFDADTTFPAVSQVVLQISILSDVPFRLLMDDASPEGVGEVDLGARYYTFFGLKAAPENGVIPAGSYVSTIPLWNIYEADALLCTLTAVTVEAEQPGNLAISDLTLASRSILSMLQQVASPDQTKTVPRIPTEPQDIDLLPFISQEESENALGVPHDDGAVELIFAPPEGDEEEEPLGIGVCLPDPAIRCRLPQTGRLILSLTSEVPFSIIMLDESSAISSLESLTSLYSEQFGVVYDPESEECPDEWIPAGDYAVTLDLAQINTMLDELPAVSGLDYLLFASPEAGSLTLTELRYVSAEKQIGDLDGSGSVNMADAFYLYRAVAGELFLPLWQTGTADLDGNRVLNMADAFVLYRRVSGI
ncbi:MAG: dockerin type I repeat-containing protein [Clostridia bacterium]|nr:dockerin type I repeat-containing protein [Clostridia bacterium]